MAKRGVTTTSAFEVGEEDNHMRTCEVGENAVRFFQSTKPPWRVDVKYDGNRQLLQFPDGTVLDAEAVASDGKQNDLYSLGKGVGAYKVFDIPWFEGTDLRGQTLNERLQLLEKKLLTLEKPQLQRVETLVIADSIAAVISARDNAIARGFEGIVVKPPFSPYADNMWLKIKKTLTAEVVVLGIIKTESWVKTHIPHSLLIGYWDSEARTFKQFGRVGAAKGKFNWREIAEDALKEVVIEDDVCIYVRPKIVLEVEYTQALSHGFREPRIVRLRRGKMLQDCLKTW
jgi:ATP-dependent DNA ligase